MVRFHPRAPCMPPFHGWDAALRTLTARVRVLPAVPTDGSRSGDQPGLQNRACEVRLLGDLRQPCLGSSTVEHLDFSTLARDRAGERSLPLMTGWLRVRLLPEAPSVLRRPLCSGAECRPHTPEVTVRLGQGVLARSWCNQADTRVRETRGQTTHEGSTPSDRTSLRWLELEYTPVSEIGARKGVRVRVPP
jgi:hypothetical protein